MVARISFPKRLPAALNYNENKCSKGHAACIAAVNYLRDANEMNFHQKLSMLELRNELNERATTKTIHVSLNFDPAENLSTEKFTAIAETYMKSIGFAEQPYLVYQHYDAGHPHMHIVSTTIKEDGSRINTHNLGRNQSEKARKEIEELFGLVKAEKQRLLSPASCRQRPQVDIVDANKIIYGKTELKRSISNVVSYVFNNYRFSSLPEYNAALKQFNVVADRGKEDGRVYKNKGLVYRVIDEKGNKIGVPIKASAIACKPTLENLEKKFLNAGSRSQDPTRTANAIDEAMKAIKNIDELITALKEKNIFTVLRQNAEGRIYGITFVDNERKAVFNGSDLGKEYSAAGLMKRLEGISIAKNATNRPSFVRTGSERKEEQPGVSFAPLAIQREEERQMHETLLDSLLSPEQQPYNNIPFQLRRKKKKRKKNNPLN